MKVNIGQVVKTFWNTIGKSSASKMINKKISDYIHSICRKYNMREDHSIISFSLLFAVFFAISIS